MINFVRTVPLHLELPADEVESLRAFAIAHGLTMAELVSRWAQSLQAANPRGLSAIHPDVIAITGLVPREWMDVKTEHQHHLLTKHSQTPGKGTVPPAQSAPPVGRVSRPGVSVGSASVPEPTHPRAAGAHPPAPVATGSPCALSQSTSPMTLEDLPSPVLEGLRRLAAESSARGIRLFLFGSFARGDARPTSDLDLGYEMPGGVQPVNRTWLFDAVAALPTIRPIDLVDFASVSPAFRNIALSEQRDLQ